MADEFDINEGLTRREALKKGAMLGGALVWAVPVVQTVGMSAAMAQIPSEGTCCLRVFLTATKVSSNRIRLDYKVKNCGPNNDDSVAMFVQENKNDTGWIQRDSAEPGTVVPDEEFAQILTRTPGPGSYMYRIYATYDCGGATGLRHNVPGGLYLTVGPVVLP